MTGPKLRRWGVRLLILAAIVGGIVLVLMLLPRRWDWSSVWTQRENLRDGLIMTIEVSFFAMLLGLVLGVIGCLLRISPIDGLRFAGACYVELIRNTPLLVQLYVAYFGIFAALRYNHEPTIGVICLGVFSGAYVTEILRAGVESIEEGQTEAAQALGMSRLQTLWYVIAPQAIRRVIPPLTGQFVTLIKDSSLLSVIAVTELTKVARTSAAMDYRYFEFYLVISLLYLALTFPLSRLSVWLERKLAIES